MTDLAQNGHLKDKEFVNYLNHLQYWKKPEYAKFLKYPMALHFLDLLQYEHFRREITNTHCAKFIEDQQLLHWQHYIRKRTRLLQQASSHHHPQSAVVGSDRVMSGSGGSLGHEGGGHK